MNTHDEIYDAIRDYHAGRMGTIPALRFRLRSPELADVHSESRLVNFSMRRPPSDDSCIVHLTEHPFVHVETIVSYRHARLVDADVLATNVEQGYFLPGQAVNLPLVHRMEDGVLLSEYTPDKVKDVARYAIDR